MAYTPSGFWSRLITRLMVSVQRWRAIEQIKEESYSLVYWREGIGVVYEGGHFLVESYKELVSCLKNLRYSCCVTLFSEHVHIDKNSESRKMGVPYEQVEDVRWKIRIVLLIKTNLWVVLALFHRKRYHLKQNRLPLCRK